MPHSLSHRAADLSIGTRLACAVGLPGLAMIAFALLLATAQWQTAGRMQRLDQLCAFTARVADLVHETQKERGMSAVYLNSGGAQMAEELPAQRSLTSQRLAQVRDALAGLDLGRYSESAQAAIRSGMATRAELDAKRADISARRITGPQSNAFFTALNAKLLAIPREAVKESDDPGISASLLAYSSYLSAKERAGQERASGAVGFAAGQFTAEQQRTYLTAVADQRSFFEAFTAYATPAQRNLANDIVKGAAIDEVEHDRDVAMRTAPGTPLGGITGSDWYKAATARINLMKQVEDHLAADVQLASGSAKRAAWRELIAEAAAIFGALAATLVITLWLAHGIIRPLNAMTAAMRQLADGETSVTVPSTGLSNEIGQMAAAVQVFRDNKVVADRLAADQEVARAARTRRQDAMDRNTQEFGATISSVMASLAGSAAGMRRAANAMSDAARAVHEQASGTAEGAAKSSHDLTAVAAAVEELSSSVAEISRQVATAADVARQAVGRADSSQATMQSLSEATARIGDVVRMISDIAGQTNLLALNATIEAARAGEAGKGFAVVAGEVKALAAQTARATADIGGQIETVRSATSEAVGAMNEIGGIIGRMDEISATIAAAVEQQGATTREIANSVQAVSGATASAAQAMSQVVDAADQAGHVSRDVESGAEDIGREAEALRAKVDEFLKAVHDDSGERRRFERLAANGVSVTLRARGEAPARVVVRDLSLSGMAVVSRTLPIGHQVEIDLPGASGAVRAEVARVDGQLVALRFGEDGETRARVGEAVRELGAARAAA